MFENVAPTNTAERVLEQPLNSANSNLTVADENLEKQQGKIVVITVIHGRRDQYYDNEILANIVPH